MGYLALLVKGLGLFNDAYQLFVMNLVNVVLNKRFHSSYNSSKESACSTSVFVGAVLGQLVIGALADQLGRKKMMVLTCSLLIVGGVLCTAVWAPRNDGLILSLIIARGILGLGIGGEYPLAATSTTESNDEDMTQEKKHRNMALVFSLQGLGQLLAAICGFVLCSIFAPSRPYKNRDLDAIWRILFMIGALPAIGIFWFRYKAEESHAFQQVEHRAHLPFMLKLKVILKNYWKLLLGTAGSWFIFDVVFYAQSIFSDTIMDSLGRDSDSLGDVSLKNLFLAIGALPGYYLAVFSINKLGRTKMQLQGFIMMALLFLLIGVIWTTVKDNGWLFIVLYSLTFFFSNFGPNTTTFILPAEVFPTHVRATCHGIAAASGKMGAIVGTALFEPLQDRYGDRFVFILCGIVSALGALLTLALVRDGPENPLELDRLFVKHVGELKEAALLPEVYLGDDETQERILVRSPDVNVQKM